MKMPSNESLAEDSTEMQIHQLVGNLVGDEVGI